MALVSQSYYVKAQVNVSKSIDEFTGIQSLYAFEGKGRYQRIKDRIDKLKEVEFSMSYVSNKEGRLLVVHFSFYPRYSDMGCLSKYDGKIILLLDNGKTIECTQNSETDCSDSPSASYVFYEKGVKSIEQGFLQSEEKLEEISKSVISKIRVYANKGYRDYEIQEEKGGVFTRCYEAIMDKL